jgi:hypothetical protein
MYKKDETTGKFEHDFAFIEHYDNDKKQYLEEVALEKPLSLSSSNLLHTVMKQVNASASIMESSAIREKDRMLKESNEKAYKLEQENKQWQEAARSKLASTGNTNLQKSYLDFLAPPAPPAPPVVNSFTSSVPIVENTDEVLNAKLGQITVKQVTASALKNTFTIGKTDNYKNSSRYFMEFATKNPDLIAFSLNTLAAPPKWDDPLTAGEARDLQRYTV